MKYATWCARVAVLLLIMLAALLYGTWASAQMPEVKRTGGYTYVCVDSADEVPDSNHNEWPAAVSACGGKAVEYGRVFRLEPGMVVTFTPQDAPPDDPPDEEPPDEEPPDEEPLDPDAPLSSFVVTASGLPETVPILFRDAMQSTAGRVTVRFTPAELHEGSQRLLYGSEHWGTWIYRTRLHGWLHRPDGTRQLWRLESVSPEPLEGTELAAGAETEFTISWTPVGTGIFVDGLLRLYLEGEFLRPPELYFGAGADGTSPYSGAISAEVYAEPLDFDVCENLADWGTVEQDRPPVPAACQTAGGGGDGCAEAGTEDVTLSWIPPTEYEDGEPIGESDLEAYRVYTDSCMLLEVPAPATATILSNQVPGRCYRMTAVAAQESALSNEACP